MLASAESDERVVVWFDIDNTLYSAGSKISQAMGERIHAYFISLGLSPEEASELHLKYYVQYGLALRGLTRHHAVDPLDFDRQCDGSLPLEDMIKFDPTVRKLFEDIDKTKVRVWTLTNAYRPHAERVLRILKLDDLIDGLVYCDYQASNFVCKPDPECYRLAGLFRFLSKTNSDVLRFQAMKQANVADPSKCYFIDDNKGNIDAARAEGWGKCVYFCELGLETVEGGKPKQISSEKQRADDSIQIVTRLDELRTIWPEIFKMC